MKLSCSRFFARALSPALVCFLGAAAFAQTPIYTYQGELKDNGGLADGSYDFNVRLYDSVTGGVLVDQTCINDRPVSNGRFTLELPFGVRVRGGSYYLEIRTRRHTAGVDCSNTSGFTSLTPRQELTAAPFANYAYVASSLGAPDGSPLSSVSVNNAGNVGIGTGNPTSQLDLFGVSDAFRARAITPTLTLTDTGTNARVVLQNAGGNYFVVSESFLNGTNGAGFTIVDPQGRLGIGTYTPNEALSIAGSMEVGTSAGDYRHIRIGGGNSSGFIYGSFPRLGDGIHMGYNIYSDATNDRIIAIDGQTSRLSTGYGYISLATAGVGQLPIDRVVVNQNGLVGIGMGFSTPQSTLHVNGSVRCTSLVQTSSAAFKDDVTPLASGLDDLVKLEPVSYVWNEKAPEESRGKHDLGFIAENVAELLPDAVGRDAEGNPVGIDYSRITVLAVKAIQEQNARHEADRAEIASLRERLARLEALLSR